MQTWRSLDEVPADLGRTVVVIGNFDGVHLGHRRVLARARALADEAELPVVAVTFEPHPMSVLRPEHAPTTLTPLPVRATLLGEAGADHVLALPFDREVAAWTPQEFVDRVLTEPLRAAVVVVGANFRFGRKAAGDVALLRELGARGLTPAGSPGSPEATGSTAFSVDGVELDGGPMVWSSTYIRTCLAAGDVAGAAGALGRPYALVGEVIRGDQRGRELGYPTANVPTDSSLAVPADGVYAGWLRRLDGLDGGVVHPAAISVGTNPTFHGERARRVESYVLDRTDLELYGVEVEVSFVERLRGMTTFTSVDELVVQMALDVEGAREVLGG